MADLSWTVEIAPGGNPADPGTWAWEDITQYVRLESGVTVSAGRPDEGQQVDTGTCEMVLDNQDGRFSARNPLGPWFGRLARNTPIRVLSGDSSARDQANAEADSAAATFFTDHVAPSVEAKASGLLVCCWATTDAFDSGNYVLPGGMTAGAVTGTGTQRMQAAWQLVIAGLTGTRTATFIAESAWNYAAVAAVLPGATTVVEEVSAEVAAGVVLQMSTAVTTQSGQWLVAINRSSYRTAMDDSPGGTPGTWMLLADTQLSHPDLVTAEIGTPWIKMWVRPVLEGGAQEVEFSAKQSGEGNHGRVIVVDTVDADQLVWIGTERFTGFVSEWPTRWDESGNDSTSPLRASGTLRRLHQGAKTLQSTLRRQIPGEELASTVKAYWPMEDQEGATQLASPVDDVRPMLIDGDIDLASADGPGGSDQLPTHRQFSTFRGALGPWLLSELNSWRVDWLFFMAEQPPADRTAMTVDTSSSTAARYRVRIGSNLTLQVFDSDDATAHEGFVALDPAFYGGWVRFILRVSSAGLTLTYRLLAWRPNGDTPILLASFSTSFAASAGRPIQVGVGNLAAEERSWGHVVVSNTDSEDADPYAGNADDGHAAERAARRIMRLCAEENVPVQIVGDPDVSTPMGSQKPGDFLGLLRDCEVADGGVLYEDVNGGLTYATRTSRYNQLTRLALDVDAGEVGEPPEPTDDDQQLRNDIIVTRTNGSSARATDDDSVQREGRYQDDVELNLRSDTQLDNAAAWLLSLGTVDEMRWPRITIDLRRNSHLIPAWLAIRPGSRSTVAHSLSQLLGVDIDLLVDGWTETLSPFVWRVELNCVPASPWRVLQVDTDEFSRPDSATSTLGASVGTTDTSLLVASGRYENFEDADLVVDLAGTWARTNSEAHGGTWSLRSAVITHSQTSDATVQVPAGAQTVQFWYRVSSEAGFDGFNFFIDGVEQFNASGEGVWTQSAVFNVTSATEITFRYAKDSSVSEGLDAAFVDDLNFVSGQVWTQAAGDLPFDIKVGGEAMAVTAVTGSTSPQTFTVTRSVNGVVKTLGSGERVGLAEPVVWAR